MSRNRIEPLHPHQRTLTSASAAFDHLRKEPVRCTGWKYCVFRPEGDCVTGSILEMSSLSRRSSPLHRLRDIYSLPSIQTYVSCAVDDITTAHYHLQINRSCLCNKDFFFLLVPVVQLYTSLANILTQHHKCQMYFCVHLLGSCLHLHLLI